MTKKTKTARLFCCGHVSYETSPHCNCKLLLFIESHYLFFFFFTQKDQSLAFKYLLSLFLIANMYPLQWLFKKYMTKKFK